MAKLGELTTICNGRLTLTSGSGVTTSDVTAATTVYFTPYKGNNIALYNTTHDEWVFYEFTERSISLSGKTADTNYDVYIYDSSGTLTLELVAWTNDTTRATALATQDGVYVKTGELNKRYLGTIRTTSTIGQCEDSVDARFCWNYYNRIRKVLYLEESTYHTYGTTTWRYWNNDSAQIVEFVIGVLESVVELSCAARIYDDALVSIGYDTGAVRFATYHYLRNANTTASSWMAASTDFGHLPGIGYHFYSLIQYGAGATCHFEDGILIAWMDF